MRRKTLFSAVLLSCLFPGTLPASPLQDGMNAFSVGDYEKAEKILRPIEKEQPSAAYLLRMIDVLNKDAKVRKNSKDIFLRELYKGDGAMLDRLGMVARGSGKVSGISGAVGLNDLILNAREGDPAAVFRMALFYQEGIGVPRDFKAAAEHFRKAADGGNASAMNSLGVYYRYGIGVPKDARQARACLTKAITAGSTYALFNLAEMIDEGDGVPRDALQAYLLSDLAVLKLNPQTEKKQIAHASYIQRKTLQELTPLQQAYLKRFVPFSLSSSLPEGYLKGRTYPKKLPIPPGSGKMIEETAFMKRIRPPEADKYKKFQPFLPAWVPFPSEPPRNPVLTGRNLPAPAADSPEMLSALYYRPSDPRQIRMTLTGEESALPLMPGDIVTLYVHTPLHETKATRKGARKGLMNTAYRIVTDSEYGALNQTGDSELFPVTNETRESEAWLSATFRAGRPGKAIVRFKPRTGNGEEEAAFPHMLLVVVSEGPKPK